MLKRRTKRKLIGVALVIGVLFVITVAGAGAMQRRGGLGNCPGWWPASWWAGC
jgi:hypothetical protein